MATLKINVSRLPYRGEPTRDTRPSLPKIPPHLKVRVLDGPWTERPHHTREERKESAIKNSKRHRQNIWTKEQLEKALEMYQAGDDYETIGKAIGRSASATEWHLSTYRSQRGIPPRPRPDGYAPARYTPQEDEIITSLFKAGYSMTDIADTVGRSRSAVANRLWVLKKRKGSNE